LPEHVTENDLREAVINFGIVRYVCSWVTTSSGLCCYSNAEQTSAAISVRMILGLAYWVLAIFASIGIE